MKSTMARLFALCLTVAMVLSMATMGAFATNVAIGQTGTITINSAASDNDAEVDLYKIMNVNLVDANGTVQPKDPMYTWVDAVATWLETNSDATYKGYINADDNAVTDSFKNATAAQLSKFFHDMKAAIEPGEDEKVELELTAAKSITISATTQEVTEMEMGQYLVIAEKSAYVYSPATVTLAPVWDGEQEEWVLNNAAVTVKGKGGIDKEVVGGDLGHAVGDTVTYRLDVAIPVYPEAGPNEVIYKTFKVGDTMGTGLDFDGVSTVKVYANTNADTYVDDDLLPATDIIYTVVKNGNGFDLTFDYDALQKALKDGDKEATYVHVVYTGTLNEGAFTVDELGNTAYVEVNTNPYDEDSYEKTTVKKKVYTYGINVTKVDAADPDSTLAGAEFTLKGADGKEIQFVETGKGIYVKYAEKAFEGPVTPVTTLVVAADGTLQLQGVDVGTYTLTETKAPGGYQLPKDDDAITKITMVDATGGEDGADGVLDQGTSKVDGTMIVTDATTVNGKVISFKLMNAEPGFELPTTGGMGTVLFTAGGLVIMACGAALVLVTLKKKKKAED